jgi:hypothetical protein
MVTIAFCLHQGIHALIGFVAHGIELAGQQSDLIHLSCDLGEAAVNGGGLAETVEDTQGIEAGETGRSAS